MSFTFRPAKRENVPLLIGIAGGTGTGKTNSALLLAKGLAGGKRFAVIDTEAGRAKHYADDFDFDHGDLAPPFRPSAYAAAIKAADDAGYPVIVVDSASHEYAGEGGILDWHDEELNKRAGDDFKKREALTFTCWVKPKGEHKAFVSKLLQLRAHVILCFRAEEKIEIVKENGKTVVRPKRSLSGFEGWMPVCEKNLPFELTLSLLLTPDAPGVPKPIKLQAQHLPFLPLDKQLGETTGRLLGAWAAGSGATTAAASMETVAEADELVERLLALADKIGNRQTIEPLIARNRAQHAGSMSAHVGWLRTQVDRAVTASQALEGPGA